MDALKDRAAAAVGWQPVSLSPPWCCAETATAAAPAMLVGAWMR